MLGLSNTLKAGYVELANTMLDQMPILSQDQFEIVRLALKHLLKTNEIQVTPSGESSTILKERVASLKELLDEPGIYVEDPSNFLEFKDIIKDRIKAKSREIKALNYMQRQEYIECCRVAQEKIAANKVLFSKAEPPVPGSEAHVIVLSPQVQLQIKEILEQFIGRLTAIRKRLYEIGLYVRLTCRIRQLDSYLDVQEDQVKSFLEKNLDIPYLPLESSVNDVREILTKFINSYIEAFKCLGITADIKIKIYLWDKIRCKRPNNSYT
jgi:hypothetical protein